VQPDFLALLALNLPLVLGFFVALQRGYLVIGRTHEQERTEWKASFEREYAEKKEAQALLVAATETLKTAADVMERAVSLAERRA
jgi:hypothetical protein